MSKRIIHVLDNFEKEANCLISNDNQIFETNLNFDIKYFDPSRIPHKKHDYLQKFDYSKLRNNKFDEFFEVQKNELYQSKRLFSLNKYQEHLVKFYNYILN